MRTVLKNVEAIRYIAAIVITAAGQVLLDDYDFTQEQLGEWVAKSIRLASAQFGVDGRDITERKKQ